MAIKKKSLIGAAGSKPKDGDATGSQKPRAKSEQSAKSAPAKKMAVAKLATAKLSTAKLTTLKKLI
jgi:hypothetical protein